MNETESSGIDLSAAFKGGQFKQVSPQFTKAEGYYPNELWHSASDRVTLIVARKSTKLDGDFSLNAKALSDLRDRIRDGRIKQAYVVFAERNGSGLRMSAHKTVEEMATCLTGISPVDGKHGPFWWISGDQATGDGYILEELRPM